MQTFTAEKHKTVVLGLLARLESCNLTGYTGSFWVAQDWSDTFARSTSWRDGQNYRLASL